MEEAYGERKQKKVDNEQVATRTSNSAIDPTAKQFIRQSIITAGDAHSQHQSKLDKASPAAGSAQCPDDVLVFSRTVHKIDSSLE